MDVYIHFHFLLGETFEEEMEWNTWRNLRKISNSWILLSIIFSFQSNQCRSSWPKAWNDGISKVLWTKAPEALPKAFWWEAIPEKGEER